MDYYGFVKQYGNRSVPQAETLLMEVGRTYRRVSGLKGEHLSPGEEWIFDNYYLLSEWWKDDKKPRIENRFKVYRQGYLIALYIVLCTKGKATKDNIVRYADLYQEYHALTIPELGVFPEMLRLSLLERIAYLCEQIESIAEENKRAQQLYNKFIALSNPEVRELDMLFTACGEITPAFVSALLKIASVDNNDTTSLRNGLARKLAGGGLSVQRLIETAHNTQIQIGGEMGSCFQSLSELRDLRIDAILSRLNRVEQILQEDPAGIFGKMARDTKHLYVEQIYRAAKKKKITPVEEALQVLEEAKRMNCHVGERISGLQEEPKQPHRPSVARTLLGMGICLLVPVLGPVIFLSYMTGKEIYRTFYIKRHRPRVLPAMDFGGRIPEQIRVMLVMPALLSDDKRGRMLLEQLRSLIPMGKASNLYCALIGDLPEHSSPEREEDQSIIESTKMACREFNQMYPDHPHYLYYIRKRVYCETQQNYAGRERKRGALLDFGAFLETQVAQGVIPEMHYVITIDADSVLTYSAMVRLVEQMEHPLNKPVVNVSGNLPIVEKGHGLIAPSAALYSGQKDTTGFSRFMGGESGFSGYGGRTSEYCFDKTGLGIYSGKGIYIPQLYRLILDAPFAPETLLSHDLIEGAFLRAGYASEVRLYESFPGDVIGYLKRMHRWIRGDWQLLPYMRCKFRDRKGILQRNPIHTTYLHIMHGNLQGSLAPIYALLLLLGGLCLFPMVGWGVLAFFFIYMFREFWLHPCVPALARCGLEVLLLPEKAYQSADAVVRTLYRVGHSRKNLLSWVTAKDTERNKPNCITKLYRKMPATFLLGAILVLLAFALPAGINVFALGLGIGWCFAPVLFYRLGQTRKELVNKQKGKIISKGERHEIALIARKIWAYYEDYAVAGDHYLPPDNVQFKPVYSVAHRTSPTNIGFLILSTAIAAELGYISLTEAHSRLHHVMNTLEQMERFQGHLYNWYDTISLTPLEPRFVSSVDSGNLVACMLAACGILNKLWHCMQDESLEDDLERKFTGLTALCACVNETAAIGSRIPVNELKQFRRRLRDGKTTQQALRMSWNLLLDFCAQYGVATPEESAENALYRGKLQAFCSKIGREEPSLSYDHLVALFSRLNRFCIETDFSFLFNYSKGLFSIGFHIREGKLSDAHYDICVSEARLMSAVAAAKGDVPEEHFGRMARRRGQEGKGILQSWSGTAFEYLLPDLFMKAPAGSLWDETAEMMIEIQKREGIRHRTPWGVSESCYNVMDLNMNYKYRAFGVTALSVQGKYEDVWVIAPYASLMAIHRRPSEVLHNLQKIKYEGGWGQYGYYEAVDYTRGRTGVVYCYMAHHLGMSLCAIANLLAQDTVSQGFFQGAGMQALQIYAQEKRPRGYSRHHLTEEKVFLSKIGKKVEFENTILPEEDRAFSGGNPMSNILSNGHLTVVTDHMGRGISKAGDILLNLEGSRIFIGNGEENVSLEGVFYPERTVYKHQSNAGIWEEAVCVTPEDDTEIRMIHSISVTERQSVLGFSGLVLNTQEAYEAHPAFSDLFITTKALYEGEQFLGLVAQRRPHGIEERPWFAFFGLYTDAPETHTVEYDTDLSVVFGRNNDTDIPMAVRNGIPLTQTVGAPITPCFAVRRYITSETQNVWLCTGLGENEQDCRQKMLKYREFACVRGAFELARTRTLVEREHIGMKPGEWRYFMDLAGSLMRHPHSTQAASLYPFGISGKRPLITIMMRRIENSHALEKMIRFWCMLSFRAFPVDLVVVAFDDGSYLSPIRELADKLAGRALAGAFGVRGELVVVVPSDGKNVQPLIGASQLVFWM